MLNNLKNIVVVSLSTVGSRVLGLARDILIFAALGASAWNDAFILAFTLPNLFSDGTVTLITRAPSVFFVALNVWPA